MCKYRIISQNCHLQDSFDQAMIAKAIAQEIDAMVVKKLKKVFTVFTVYIITTCSAWGQETLTFTHCMQVSIEKQCKA